MAGTCETCAAFYGVYTDGARGLVGNCALEVIKAPVPASATCSRYRPKGASAAAERPRAAGEPRRRAGGASAEARPLHSLPTDSVDRPAHVNLPKEIDIDMDIEEFRRVLREVLADELGVSRPPLGARWEGGELVLRPGKEGTQEKRVPIEAFFHKIVMVRDKLRLLEAKVNGHAGLSDEDKVQLQAYITGCYGSLTTFNVLFANKTDQLTGASTD